MIAKNTGTSNATMPPITRAAMVPARAAAFVGSSPSGERRKVHARKSTDLPGDPWKRAPA
jgi:hypothetical protein